jgi:hypothetical protein
VNHNASRSKVNVALPQVSACAVNAFPSFGAVRVHHKHRILLRRVCRRRYFRAE